MSGTVTRDCVYQRHSKHFKFFRAFLHLFKILTTPVLLIHLLSACAVEGDFGRIQPTVFSKISDQVLLNADIMTRGLNRPELNRDEIVLRETGHILTRPLELAPQMTDIPPQLPEEMRGRYEREVIVPPPGVITRSLDKDHQVLTRFGE